MWNGLGGWFSFDKIFPPILYIQTYGVGKNFSETSRKRGFGKVLLTRRS
jgi:hypothetical protein